MKPPTTYTESGRSMWARWFWAETLRVSAHVERERAESELQRQWFETLYEGYTSQANFAKKAMKGKK
jgi:hypothetical protein